MSIKEIEEFMMLSSETDRKAIKEDLEAMANALQRIEDERSFIKDKVALLAEKFTIPKKVLNKMAKTVHKQNYLDVAAESDRFTTAYETLYKVDTE